MVANSNLVPTDDSVTCRLSSDTPNKEIKTESPISQRTNTPTVFQAQTSGHSFIRESIGKQSIPDEVMAIIYRSWRDKTSSKYGCVLRKWKLHCIQKNVDPFITDVNNILEFLHCMYTSGFRYSAICTARVIPKSGATIPKYEKLSNHRFISRHVKDIFNQRPPLSKYIKIWDINSLLTNNDIYDIYCQKLQSYL